MSKLLLVDFLDVARRAAGRGGAVVSGWFGRDAPMRAKAPGDFVGEADLESERAIVAEIRAAFPDHAILAEESHAGDAAAEHLWVVDPLDGTTNFAHGIAHVAVSVAYYRGGRPECGVVYNPMRDDWFTAAAGRGAWHNGRRARVAASPKLDEILIGTGFYYDRGAMMRATLAAIDDLFGHGIHGIRRFGTAALDLCMVGTGSFGAFFEYELAPWDFAAGRLFVEEAGGKVTTCRGGDLPVRRSTVLATNGLVHEAMLAVIGPHTPDRHL